MSAQGTPEKDKSFDAELRKDLLKLLILVIPTVLITLATTWLANKVSIQPGHTLWVLIPASVFLSFFFVVTATRQRLVLGWKFVIAIVIYIVAFFVAAHWSVLDWKHTLVGYDEHTPSNFLALNYFGDWHYWFAPAKTEDKDLVIVWLKPAQSTEERRSQLADLIGLAQTYDAKGVALDFYFEDGDEDTRIDEFLCMAIDEAKKLDRPIPVFAAYDYVRKDDNIDQLPIDVDLKPCLPDSNQGHAIGYAEWDGKVRSIPLYFRRQLPLESISLKVAKSLDSQVKVPDNGLLQFVAPLNDFPTITLEGLEQASEVDRAVLRNRFILVGEDSPEDSFETPYGRKPGVTIHAYAIHSLRQNLFIRRGVWWVNAMMIFLLCYLIMFLTSREWTTGWLVLATLSLSVIVAILSALFMYLWLAWIDLVYPLLASWLFLIILIGLRKARERRAAVVQS